MPSKKTSKPAAKSAPASPKSTEAAQPKTTARTLQESDLKRLPWRSVGPAIMGGRISDICFSPSDTKAWYIAYATGGLWRTKNHGTTFEPLFDNEVTSCLGSVAVADAPADWSGWDSSTKKGERLEKGKDKIIYVGTGEGNGRNSSSWGCGVFKSVDSGKTWKNVGLENTHDIPRIAVDPRNPDVCYVAALGHLWGRNKERGLYKTSDGGQTWELVHHIDSNTGCCDVLLDPQNPDVVYAAFYDRLRTPYSFTSGGPKGGIFKSVDGGKTFKQLKKGLPDQTGRIGLDAFLGDPNKLVAVVESTQDGANSIRDDRMRGGGVFRSDDGGETWRRCSYRSPRAFYFSKVRFDSKDADRIYMQGWTTEVSEDGGETFRAGWGDILHADHHAIVVDPNDPSHIVIGTDGGAYQTFDKGANWDFLNTMAVGQFYNIALDDSEPYRISGGLQDNGSWVFPSATNRQVDEDKACRTPQTGITNADIEFVLWGDGFHTAFQPGDPNVVYAEWQGGNLTRVNLKTGERRWLIPEAREGQPRHRFNWNSPFLVSAHESNTLYLGGNRIFKLTKQGEKWEAISPDLTTNHPDKMTTVGSNAETYCTVVSLSESPLKKGLLWAGSDDGLIHVTTDDGKNWANVTPPAVDGLYVSRLHASAHDENVCYATIDGHRSDNMDPLVLMTSDLGKSWKNITGDLPKGWTTMVVREDLNNPKVLYMGTENALYVSLDQGKTYVKLHGKGLPTVPVYDIQQHPRVGDLVLATHGRSVWVLDDPSFLASLTAEVLASPLHLFPLKDVKPGWKLAYNGLWSHKMFRAPNPPMGVRIDYWITEYTGDEVSISISNGKDVVVKKLGGSNAPGFNRVVWNLQPEDWQKMADKGEDEFMNDFHARPGEYKVKLTMGDHSAEGTFQILQ